MKIKEKTKNQEEMEKVLETVKNYTTIEGNIFVENFTRRYVEQGIVKGRQETLELAIEKAIRKGKYNLTEIADIFDVSIDFVLDVKNKMDKNINF